MECARIREALLEGPERAADSSLQWAIEMHLPACAECRRLSDALTRMDEGLSSHLRPAVLHPAFGARLRERLVHERHHVWAAWLPAAVHFASCGVATAGCVALLPDQAGLVAAAAAGITVVSHFLLTTAQDALDAAGD
jgi:predicted anti-sigma-YlaC factor YlaD